MLSFCCLFCSGRYFSVSWCSFG